MGGNSLYVGNVAIFPSHNIPVAHERHLVAFYSLYAVEYISSLFHSCQRNDASTEVFGLGEDYALPVSDDERQHAASCHWKCNTVSIVKQCYCLVDNFGVVHIVLLVIIAASLSGRQSVCHTAVWAASVLRVL